MFFLAATVLSLSPLTASAEQREFNLTIDEVKIPVAPGLDYQVFAFNGQVPGPLMHVKEGDEVTVHGTNNTTIGHSIHWHGIYHLNNWQNDGVLGVSQKEAIEPGESFTYRWKAEKTGSLWYHCHMNVNEHVGIRGMWGPLVVDPKKPTELEKRVTKDVIMMLSSWDSNFWDKRGFGGGPLEHKDMNYFSINAKSFPMNQPIRVKKG
ncbi:MAG: multicopper oxidase domain-containing protein, partial [Nitrospirae bacterium]|nr:multicopper oxidase domain-containing protein [Nitrospirota bacterium]